MTDTHVFKDDGSGLTCDDCELGPNHPRHARHAAAEVPDAPVVTHGPAGGATYEERRDLARLSGQRLRVYEVIKDGGWWTAAEVADRTGDAATPVGARIRDFRKAEFGRHTVIRRVRPGTTNVHEYRFTHRLADTA